MEQSQLLIIASLEAGESTDEIAARLELPISKVLRVKNQYDKAIMDGTLDQLVDVNELVLAQAGQLAKDKVPTLSDSIDTVTKEASEGLDRLRKLDDQLIATAVYATNRIRMTIATAQTHVEIADMVASLCRLRESFFNKNVTQVNIQNNLSNSQAYGDWLNDKPN